MTFLCERVISPSCTWMCPNSFNERKCNFQAAVLQEPGTIAFWNSWYKFWATLTHPLFTLMWLKMCTSNSQKNRLASIAICPLKFIQLFSVADCLVAKRCVNRVNCDLGTSGALAERAVQRRQAPCCASPARWNLTMRCSLDSVQLPYKWLNCGVYSRYSYSSWGL